MFCTSCGANLGTRSLKFCLQCGAPLKPRADAPAAAEAGPSAAASLETDAPVEPVSPPSGPLAWDTADFLDVLRIPETGTGGGDAPWEDRYASESAPPPASRDTGIGGAVAIGIVCAVLAATAGGAWWFFSQPEAPTTTTTTILPPHDPATGDDNDASALATETSGGEAETIQPPQTGATTEPSQVTKLGSLPENQRIKGHNNPNIQPVIDTAPHSHSSSTAPKQTEHVTPSSSSHTVSRQPDFSSAQSTQSGQSIVPPVQSGQFEISGQSGAITAPEIPDPPAHTEPRQAPPTRIATGNRRHSEPPWLNQMREDLENCADFFCRENVRKARCKGRWKSLPECKSAAL
ncbi:MAG: hypothetical protein LBF50_10480 [Azoarcus sp.]|jgi:hypothetical protein|nr:hypothetical protein [Azoarcus sp.]